MKGKRLTKAADLFLYSYHIIICFTDLKTAPPAGSAVFPFFI